MKFLDKIINAELEEKYFKRIVFIAMIFILLCLVIVFFNFGFMPNYKPTAKITTIDDGEINCSVDTVEVSKKFIEITGWAYKIDQNIGYFDNRFVIRNEATKKYKALNTKMKMVDEFYSIDGEYDCRRAGMYAKGFALGIPEGLYRIFIEYKGDGENLFIDTGILFNYE